MSLWGNSYFKKNSKPSEKPKQTSVLSSNIKKETTEKILLPHEGETTLERLLRIDQEDRLHGSRAKSSKKVFKTMQEKDEDDDKSEDSSDSLDKSNDDSEGAQMKMEDDDSFSEEEVKEELSGEESSSEDEDKAKATKSKKDKDEEEEDLVLGGKDTFKFDDSSVSEDEQSEQKKKLTPKEKDAQREARHAKDADCTVFIQNVNKKLDYKTIGTFLRTFGRVVSYRIRCVARDVDTPTHGFYTYANMKCNDVKKTFSVFAVFKNPETAENIANQLDGLFYEGFHLRADVMSNKGQHRGVKRTVTIAGLPYKTEEEDVRKWLDGKGLKVERVALLRIKETQQCSGFGFVTFENKEDVEKVYGFNGDTLLNRTIRFGPYHKDQNKYLDKKKERVEKIRAAKREKKRVNSERSKALLGKKRKDEERSKAQAKEVKAKNKAKKFRHETKPRKNFD
ncbi:nucleolar protein, putative [Entamoeba invadens IP1]|uniref:Nucleolar protein, putative n=1 Tax=Entamoeba invadens IP1 TaxID=370355 RepID=A0A0A1UGH8_ENTIV|nr:nucleolar protein, putative [Entamoeba invadens IP1]ELP94924.1 nucleolar protein, putative [Entamoeba invadens IP1]|eukprot:XP_004261695.1 nucleolar protein, putative [Entamoeba invadens IP1]